MAPPGVSDTSAASWTRDANWGIIYGCRFVAMWYNKLLMGSVVAIWTDARRGSYLEFAIVVFRKFAGRESRWPSRALR